MNLNLILSKLSLRSLQQFLIISPSHCHDHLEHWHIIMLVLQIQDMVCPTHRANNVSGTVQVVILPSVSLNWALPVEPLISMSLLYLCLSSYSVLWPQVIFFVISWDILYFNPLNTIWFQLGIAESSLIHWALVVNGMGTNQWGTFFFFFLYITLLAFPQ